MMNINNPFNLFTFIEEETKKKNVASNVETKNPTQEEQNAAEETHNHVDYIDVTKENNPTEQTIQEHDCIDNDKSSNSVEPKTNEEDEQLSLIESLSKKKDEAEAAKEKEAEEKAKSSGKSSSTANNTFEVNESTVIRFFHDVIPLTKYFTVEEIVEGVPVEKKDGTIEYKKIDGEMVRQRLEKDYPIFVKGSTEMVYYGGKRNFIIPAIVAKKKGNIGVDSEQEVSMNDTSFPFPNKIPFRLLEEFISIAKVFGKFQLEVRAEIYYNFDTNRYLLHVPRQTVHKYWVESNESPGYFQNFMLDKYEHYVQLVCEIHSHHVLAPIPSETDNQSERVPGMFYVIVGHTNRNIPSVYCRTFTLEHGHTEKNVAELFSVFENNYNIIKWNVDDIIVKS